jgi:hypothetical protein
MDKDRAREILRALDRYLDAREDKSLRAMRDGVTLGPRNELERVLVGDAPCTACRDAVVPDYAVAVRCRHCSREVTTSNH